MISAAAAAVLVALTFVKHRQCSIQQARLLEIHTYNHMQMLDQRP
jgi:hypothetical protein